MKNYYRQEDFTQISMKAIISRKTQNDMTIGAPLKRILLFAIPIFIGNIFQQLYNVIDTVVVGHVLREDALAAIGAASVIYSLFVSLNHGMTNGFSIVIARYFGSRDDKKMRQSIAMSYLLAILIGTTLTIISMLCLRPFLVFLGTPEDILNQSDQYIRIILAASLITMAYNIFAAVLRAVGNSVIPLVFLIISSVINIVLDILFVKYMGIGISGAALATVIAQLVSAVLCGIYIFAKCPILRVTPKDFVYDRKMMAELLTTGFSMAMMYAIVSLGTIVLQSAINGLGKITIAAHTSARKITEIFFLPFGTLATAASTFVSQNYGASQGRRIRQGIRGTIMISLIWAVICNLIVFTMARTVLQLMTGSESKELLDTAASYLRFDALFYFILPVLLVLRSSLQGVGHRIVPLFASGMELVVKFVAAMLLTPVFGYFGIIVCEPISWSICAVMVVVDYAFFLKKHRNNLHS